jgi:hypothetical protein
VVGSVENADSCLWIDPISSQFTPKVFCATA